MPASQPWVLEAVGNARWRGGPLRRLLDEAGLTDRAVEILFTGLDRGVDGGSEQSYQRSLPIAEARRDDVVLAYEMNGAPLVPQHGAPLRLIVPGWYGMTNVKWLTAITAIDHPFDGYQQEQAYRVRRNGEDEGVALTRILPRALMVPPGPRVPDARADRRPGDHVLEGRAWSGHAPIARVEVSDDDGESWQPAELSPEESDPGPGVRGRTAGRLHPGGTPSAAPRTRRERAAARAGVERRRLREQQRAASSGHRFLEPVERERVVAQDPPRRDARTRPPARAPEHLGEGIAPPCRREQVQLGRPRRIRRIEQLRTGASSSASRTASSGRATCGIVSERSK
jgi:hypothetical protein